MYSARQLQRTTRGDRGQIRTARPDLIPRIPHDGLSTAVLLVRGEGHVDVDVAPSAVDARLRGGCWVRIPRILPPFLCVPPEERALGLLPHRLPPLRALLLADRLRDGGRRCPDGAEAELRVDGIVGLLVGVQVVGVVMAAEERHGEV